MPGKICYRYLLFLLLLASGNMHAQAFEALDVPVTSWKFSEAGKDDWKTADVPGCIHKDLLSHNLLPDPTDKDQIKKCQWVEEKTWEYATTLRLDSLTYSRCKGKCKELVFESLDTYSDVFLNDSLLLHTDNMFRTYTVRVDDKLHLGDNRLLIRFYPAAATARLQMKDTHLRYPAANDSTSPFTRKPAVEYGWDFAPPLGHLWNT